MRRLVAVLAVLLLVGCGGANNAQIAQLQQACSQQPQPCKVTICHYPPGNPENVQTITISCNALDTHLEHHQDHEGECNCEQDGVNCPPPPPVCEDGVCNGEETCETCSVDCGQCPPPPPTCGDQQCNGEEDCEVCPQDCGECPVVPDAGVPDSGTVEPDGGTIGPDSGPTLPDSGVTPPPPVDSGKAAFAGGCNMAGNSAESLGLIVFALLVIVLLLVVSPTWYKSKWAKYLIVLLVVAGIVCMANLVFASPADPMKPAPSATDYWVTQSGSIANPSAGLLYDYDSRPLRVISKPGNDTISDVVTDRHSLHLLGTVGLYDRVELALDLPLVLDQIAGDLSSVGLQEIGGGVGDLRLLTKFRLFSLSKMDIALGVNFLFPTASAELVGESSASVNPKAIISGSIGRFDLAWNVGVEIRDGEDLTSAGIEAAIATTQFTTSAAARFHALKYESWGLNILSDIYTAIPLRDVDWESAPVEWINGLEADLPGGWSAKAGAGVGITRAAALPELRALVGLTWTWEEQPAKCIEMKPPVVTVVKPIPHEVLTPVPVPVIVPVFPPVYFAFDKSDLTLEAQSILNDVADFYKAVKGETAVEIIGHTDNRGTDDYNQSLSERRVNAVRQYLEANGVASDKITSGAEGEKNPAIKDADTEPKHARNRRVTVQVDPYVMQ